MFLLYQTHLIYLMFVLSDHRMSDATSCFSGLTCPVLFVKNGTICVDHRNYDHVSFPQLLQVIQSYISPSAIFPSFCNPVL